MLCTGQKTVSASIWNVWLRKYVLRAFNFSLHQSHSSAGIKVITVLVLSPLPCRPELWPASSREMFIDSNCTPVLNTVRPTARYISPESQGQTGASRLWLQTVSIQCPCFPVPSFLLPVCRPLPSQTNLHIHQDSHMWTQHNPHQPRDALRYCSEESVDHSTRCLSQQACTTEATRWLRSDWGVHRPLFKAHKHII